MECDDQSAGDAPQAERFRFLFDPVVTLAAVAGQRRRFASSVGTLTVEELASPSRCARWTVADVLRHLIWVDTTMRRLWSGDESPVAGFDPRTTPDTFVQADRAVPDEEIVRRYLSSSEAMAAELESADPQRFGRPCLSPAGRVPWWLSAVHLGWDAAIHERDALVPLGRLVEVVPAETAPCLAYSLVLAALFDRHGLDVQVGTIRLRSGEGPVTAWAQSEGHDSTGGDPGSPEGVTTVLAGDPVVVVDALCGRGSLADAVGASGVVTDQLGGLARYFASRP